MRSEWRSLTMIRHTTIVESGAMQQLSSGGGLHPQFQPERPL